MAFKILSSEEIELLTKEQRACYEEELFIYNERVRFVEQMEKFENTVIQPYQPVLEPIPAISKVPEAAYSAVEYKASVNEVKTISAPEISEVDSLSIDPLLPEHKTIAPIHIFIQNLQ